MTEPLDDNALARHVLGLLDDETRERWGWRALSVVGPDHRSWPGPTRLRMYASGLLIPWYVGWVDIDPTADDGTVVFEAIDQKAPAEEYWRRSPPPPWWERLATHPYAAGVLAASARSQATPEEFG